MLSEEVRRERARNDPTRLWCSDCAREAVPQEWRDCDHRRSWHVWHHRLLPGPLQRAECGVRCRLTVTMAQAMAFAKGLQRHLVLKEAVTADTFMVLKPAVLEHDLALMVVRRRAG